MQPFPKVAASYYSTFAIGSINECSLFRSNYDNACFLTLLCIQQLLEIERRLLYHCVLASYTLGEFLAKATASANESVTNILCFFFANP